MLINGKGNPEPIDYAIDITDQPFAFPGGYPRAILTDDGALLCAKCAAEEMARITGSIPEDGFYPDRIITFEAGPEDDDGIAYCDHCGRDILDM